MARVILFQLDGTMPNIALMRIAEHHRGLGDAVELREAAAAPLLWDTGRELVYASLIFQRTRPKAEMLKRMWPQAIIGGTGWNLADTLEAHGIKTRQQDYSIYPGFRQSMGFTQRGCRRRCPFCCVPQKEGAVVPEQTIGQLWRGESWPRELILLDNDFFGQSEWSARIEEMRAGHFKVNFHQGINARMLTSETAAAIASVDYRDRKMKERRIHTAWDNSKDERRLFAGLECLTAAGVRPRHIMVYMLIGYWPGETAGDWEYRRRHLRKFGAVPYPMPYVRTRETVGFQRFVVGAYDKRIKWADFVHADYQPRKLGLHTSGEPTK